MIPENSDQSDSPVWEDLHDPYLPLLHALLTTQPVQAQRGIDIGCGNGHKSAWLLRGAEQVYGIDIDRRAVQQAQRRGVIGVVGDACALPFADASFDAAWMIAVLGSLAEPQRALAEARRMLRPAGRLLLLHSETRWVRPRRWPRELYAVWAERSIPAPGDDLGADLCSTLHAAGFAHTQICAYLLDHPEQTPLAAALPLIAWAQIQAVLGNAVAADLAAECAAIEADVEPDPLPILFTLGAV